jgi:hypothetical protein
VHLSCGNTNDSVDHDLGGLPTTAATAALPVTLVLVDPREFMPLRRRVRSHGHRNLSVLRAVTTTTVTTKLLLQEQAKQLLRQLLRLNVTTTTTIPQQFFFKVDRPTVVDHTVCVCWATDVQGLEKAASEPRGRPRLDGRWNAGCRSR